MDEGYDALFGVSIENIYIRNFGTGTTRGILLNRNSETGDALAIRQCQLKHVTVQSFTYNVEVVDSWTFALYRCFLWNAGQFNLFARNPTHLYAEACRFDVAGSDCVRLINSNNPYPGVAPLFVNCTFQKAQFWGLQAIDLQSCYLINPFFEQNNLNASPVAGHCYFSDGAGQYGRHFAIYGGHLSATGVGGTIGVRVGRAEKVVIETDFQSTTMNSAVVLDAAVKVFEDGSRYAGNFLEIAPVSANTIVRRSGHRANHVPNNTMVGAATGSSGTMPTGWASTINVGLTRDIKAISTENGIRYIDLRFHGTTTGTQVQIGFVDATTVPAADDQMWYASAFVKDVSSLYAGSLTGVTGGLMAIRERDSGGGNLSLTTSAFALAAGNLQEMRFGVRRFTQNASTAYAQGLVIIEVANATAVDFTVRIGLPQLDRLPYASPVMYTGGFPVAEFV